MSRKEKAPVVRQSVWVELGQRFKQNPFIFIGTIVILIITVIAFVLVPVLSDLGRTGGGGSLNFGSYDGEAINFVPGNYFSKQRDYYIRQYQASGNQDYSQYTLLSIWRNAFEATVIHMAALKNVTQTGFTTPTTVIDQQMAEQSVFQENGRFSATKYRSVSEATRMEMRQEISDAYMMSMYVNGVLDLKISKLEIEAIKQAAAKERTIELVLFPLSAFPDSELRAYALANGELFRQIRLSKITFSSSESDAKKILERVQTALLSFEDAVKTYSKDELVDKNGDMGLKYSYELQTEIPDAAQLATVLALGQGALSPVVKVPAGWAFFRCDQAAQAADPTDSALIEKVRAYIYSFNRGVMEDYLITQADDFIARATKENFNAAAQAFGLEVKTIGPAPLNYGDMEFYNTIRSDDIPYISTNSPFLRAAFTTDIDAIAEPIVVGDQIAVLHPVSEEDSDESMLSLIDFYYPYIASQYSESLLRSHIISSPKLKDKFYDTFISLYMSD